MIDERPEHETSPLGGDAATPGVRPILNAGAGAPPGAPLSGTDDSSDMMAAVRFADLTGTGAPDSGFPFKFGDFRIVREAGRGGMGIVYEAVQVSLERRVALKILPPGLLADARAVARFHREARITASLHHPNIVTVHAMGMETGVPYYAMEYAAGLTLQQILKAVRSDGDTTGAESHRASTAILDSGAGRVQTPPMARNEAASDTPQGPTLPASLARFLCTDTPGSPADALDADYYRWVAVIFAEVTEGLQEAHQHGIVHRDLKPSNLILDWNGRLRILDFGLAFVEGQTGWTASEERPGTPLYMSPEQVGGHQDLYGPSTDVYSLGASLYEMLAFKPPLEGRSRDEIMDKILTREPVAPRRVNRRIPRDLETVVLTCLRKDPRDRYVSAHNFGEDLRRFVRGEPVRAQRRPVIEQALHALWRARRPIARGAAALALLVTAIVLARSHFAGREAARLEAYDSLVRDAAMDTMRAQLIAVSENLGGVRGRRREITPAKDLPVIRSTYDGGIGDLFEVFTVEPGLGAIGPDPLQMAERSCAEAQALLRDKAAAYYQLGNVELARGRNEEAEEQLRAALEKDRTFAPARSLLAALLEHERDSEAAAHAAALDELARHPGNEWVTSCFEVQRARLAKDWIRAAEAYAGFNETASGQDAEHYPGCLVEKHIGEGVALLNAGDIKASFKRFLLSDDYCRKKWPKAIEPALFLAKIHYMENEPRDAEKTLDDLFARADLPDPAAVARAITEIHRDGGRPELALRWSDKMAAGPARLCLRAELHAMLQAPEAARAELAEAVRAAPGEVDIQLAAGKAYLLLEDYAAAERAFRSAEKLAPSAGKPSIALAACLILAGKTRDAVAVLEGAFSTDQCSRAYQYLAGIRAAEQDFAAAEDDYRKAIDVDGDNAQALNNLGTLLDIRGRRAEAMECYRRATRAAPALAIAHFNFGWALHRQRRFVEAAYEYRLAIRFGMAGEEAVHNNLGPCLQYLGDLEGALAEYQEALRLDKERDNYLANHSMGTLYEWRGELDIALTYMERAAGMEPRWVDAQNDLGYAYQQLGLSAKALECYDIVFKLDPDFVWAHNNRATLVLQERLPPPSGENLEAAIVRLEDASRLLGADPAVPSLLAEYRRLLGPRVGSYGSVDELVDGPETLVADDAAWRFRRGTEAPAPGCEWTEPAFDDGAWEEGAPAFGYPPDGDVRTPLADMRGGYSSLYLRRKFHVRDPADVAALALVGRLNDGLVVYVNGKEAGRLRAGAPGTVLPHTATADGGGEKPWLRCEMPLDAAALRAGENVLALQALNNRLDSSSFFLLPALQARTRRIDQRLPGLDARLEMLRRAAQGPSDRLHASYFEGRLCEARGRPDEARARYEEVLAADRSRPEPFVRLAACLAATEGAGVAETALRTALESGLRKSIMLWEEWFRTAVVDARKSAADLVRGFPCAPESLEGTLQGLPADLAWVATELAGRAVIRINCGGSAFRAEGGSEWGGDRFFTSGNRTYLSGLGARRLAFPDPALYHTARWFGESSPAVAAYRISLPRGRYEVRLHFIEGAREETGSRAFSVMLEGEVVAPSLVPGSAGYGVPRRDAYTLRVDDGALDIAFGRVAASPQIAGIEVESRGP